MKLSGEKNKFNTETSYDLFATGYFFFFFVHITLERMLSIEQDYEHAIDLFDLERSDRFQAIVDLVHGLRWNGEEINDSHPTLYSYPMLPSLISNESHRMYQIFANHIDH